MKRKPSSELQMLSFIHNALAATRFVDSLRRDGQRAIPLRTDRESDFEEAVVQSGLVHWEKLVRGRGIKGDRGS